MVHPGLYINFKVCLITVSTVFNAVLQALAPDVIIASKYNLVDSRVMLFLMKLKIDGLNFTLLTILVTHCLGY